MTIVLIIVGVLILLAIIFIAIRNSMISSRNRVDEAWSGIDVQLKRRHDLVPNLVEAVKGYAQHERETFEKVTQARAAAVVAEHAACPQNPVAWDDDRDRVMAECGPGGAEGTRVTG